MALPTSNLTVHMDASDVDNIWKNFQAGTPYHNGVPVNDDEVQVWVDEAGGDIALIQTTVDAKPRWRSSTPLMSLPCLDFDGTDDRMALWNQPQTVQKNLSDIISAGAFVFLATIYVEGSCTNNANIWQNTGLWSDGGAYAGVHLKTVSLQTTVYGFNWDGNADTVGIDIGLNTSYLVVYWHQGGNVYLEVYDANGQVGTQQSAASGNTQVLTGEVSVGQRAGGGGNFPGRIGEYAFYNAYDATDLANAIQYFRDKWMGSTNVPVIGLPLTSAIGTVSVSASSGVSVAPTGLSATASISSVTVELATVVSGMAASSDIGSVVVSGDTDVLVTGLSLEMQTFSGVLTVDTDSIFTRGVCTLLLAFDTGAAIRGESPGGWFWDIYTPNIVMHYGEEGKGIHSLLLGGSDGHLYQYAGDDDAGEPFSMEFTTPARDQGQPRENKLYGDIMLDVDTDTLAVTATPFLNNNSTGLPAVTVTTANRILVTVPLLPGAWQTARNISLNIVGSIAAGVKPLYYIWEPRYTFESAPIAALSWEISPTTFGMENFKHFGIAKITHVSTVDLNLTFTVDGIVQPVIVVPNSAGIYTQTIFRVPVMKGKIFKLRIESSDGVTDVRLDPRDTFFEVKNWSSDGPYDRLRIFGDYSLVEG